MQRVVTTGRTLHGGSDEFKRERNSTSPGRGEGGGPPLPCLRSNNCQLPGITEESRQWWREVDQAWLLAMRPLAIGLRAQARRARRAGDVDRADRRAGKAVSVLEERSARVASCGTTYMTVACKCGPTRVAVGCGQRWTCEDCRARYYRKVRRDSLSSWNMHENARRRQWQSVGGGPGSRWGVYFVRLSVRHTGDIAADRASIERGWRRLRGWLCWRLGRDYPEYATRKGTCSFPYEMLWECTPGADALGHVHAHVIVMWPFVDWADVHHAWCRVTEGASNHVAIQKARAGARGAAVYAAKYASKGVEVGKFAGAMAGALLAAWYGKRVVTASRRFWWRRNSRCRDCGCGYACCERPDARPASWDQRARYVAAAQAPPVVWLRECGLMDTYRAPAQPLRER